MIKDMKVGFPAFRMKAQSANYVLDWKEGASIQCYESQAHCSNCAPYGGTR